MLTKEESKKRFGYNHPYDSYEETNFSLLEEGDQIVIFARALRLSLVKVTVTKVTKRWIHTDNEMVFNRSSGILIGYSDSWDPIRIEKNQNTTLMSWAEADEEISEKIKNMRMDMLRTKIQVMCEGLAFRNWTEEQLQEFIRVLKETQEKFRRENENESRTS